MGGCPCGCKRVEASVRCVSGGEGCARRPQAALGAAAPRGGRRGCTSASTLADFEAGAIG
eukprot:2616589-Pleurochrysis_carterae.AAC.1